MFIALRRYAEYRSSIIDHLSQITLRHWDESIRQLGAQSLRRVCEVDLEALASQVIPLLSERLSSVDSLDTHGALLALGELASSFGTRPGGPSLDVRHRVSRFCGGNICVKLRFLFRRFSSF